MERRAPLALFFVIAVLVSSACGGAPPESASRAHDPDPARVEDATQTSGGGEDQDAAAQTSGSTTTESSATDPDTACASLLDFEVCRASGRCVWEGTCRDPESECELLRPEPVFDGGDPCERLRQGCAWSTSARRCVPFVAVPACPATLAEANELSVQCDHSGQVALACWYGQTRCGCERETYCGGAAPPPQLEHPAASFVCIPPIDDRGCPTSPIRDGSRCSASPQLLCQTCMTSAQCVNGRWRVRQLPPRP